MKELNSLETSKLLEILRNRFLENMNRHKNISWELVQEKLLQNPEKLIILQKMEETLGEPDIVDFDEKTGEFVFFDCSKETPKSRVSVCYDEEARISRKKFPPENSAEELAKEIGIEILSEEEYFFLQTLGNFDTKTSSWIKTSPEIRKLGGAIFGDSRFGRTFIYHNGAESYYGSRGFRGKIKI